MKTSNHPLDRCWPLGDSEMARRVREHDWTATPLGPSEAWPERLRAVVELTLASPLLSTIAVGPQRLLIYNDVAARFYGDRHPAALGRPLAESFPESFPSVAALYDRVFAGEAVTVAAQPLDIRDDGSGEMFDAYLTPLRGADGAVIAAHMTGFEVGGRERTARALRQSEERLRRVLETDAVGIMFFNLDGQLIGANDAFLRMTGYAREAVDGGEMHWRDMTPPEWVAESDAQMARLVELGRIGPYEKEYLAADGDRRWMLFAGRDLGDGTIAEYAMDISDRKQAENELRESESRLKTLFDSIDEGYAEFDVILDENGQVIDWRYVMLNAAFMRLTGMDDVAGRLISEIVPGLEPEWFELYTRVLKTGEPLRFELPAASLAHWYEVYASRFGGADSRRIVVVYNDITERKRAEANLRASEERQTFLLRLSDELHAEDGVEAVGNRAVAMLTEQLGVDRVYLVTLAPGDDDTVTVTHEARRQDLPPLEGSYRSSDFPSAIREIFERTIVYEDVRLDERLSDLDRESFAALDAVGFLAASIRRGRESMIWAAGAVSTRPRQWTEAEVTLFEDAVERTWAAIERARAEEALRESEAERRRLITEMNEGFCILEVILDDAGNGADYRFLETNPAFVRQGGFDPAGRLMSEIAPIEPIWPAAYGRVATTGVPERIVDAAAAFGRMYDVYAFRIGNPADHRIAVFFTDITARRVAERALRASEERQAFLLKLSDALRRLVDPIEIQTVAARLLGEHLGASRVFYVTVDRNGDTADVRGDYVNGVASRTGRYSLSAFSQNAVKEWRAARIASSADVDADPRYTEAERAAYAAVSTRAGFGVPLIKEGRLAALLGVNQSEPREWTDLDMDLAREVAERTWDAVERARAEAGLRDSEARLAAAFEGVPVGAAVVDLSGATVIANTEYRRFLPTNVVPSRDPIRGARWRAWDAQGRVLDREDFPAARAMRGESVVPGQEMLYTDNDGGEIWTSVATVPIRDEQRRVTGLVTAIADIDAVKRGSQALAFAEQRQRALIEGMPQFVWRAIAGGHWTWASPQWTAFTGQAEPASHGWGWLEALHPDDRERARQDWAMAIGNNAMAAEYRIRRAEDGVYRWFQTRATPARGAGGAIVEWLGTSTDVDDLRTLQQRQQVLLLELQHRVRNILTVVRSVFGRSAERSSELEHLVQHFQGRLGALARTHVVVTRRVEGTVAFEDMIRDEMLSIGVKDGPKLRISGPEVELDARTAETLSLAIHELTTNALKYGAFSVTSGSLYLAWQLNVSEGGQQRLTIEWLEQGVPIVGVAPSRTGFGRELLEEIMPYQLGADTKLEFRGGGVRCLIFLPLARQEEG